MKGGKSSCLMFSRGDASWGISLSYVTNEVSRKGFLSKFVLINVIFASLISDDTRIILTLSFELDKGFEAKRAGGIWIRQKRVECETLTRSKYGKR